MSATSTQTRVNCGPQDDEAKAAPALPRLLVVDDIDDNREILVRRFQRHNFEVREADCGTTALNLIATDDFDAILLDVMMPDISGLDVLKQLRVDRSPGSLPIIMVTAKRDSADVVEALRLGANDYLTKPVDFAVALARVTAQVERKRARQQLEQANAALKRSNDRLLHEIAQRVRFETKTEYLIHRDALTGLSNRTLLHERLGQAIFRAARHSRWVAVICVDLDNFKIINESLGHGAGDELLRIVAKRLVACVRDTDTVARLSGDEFVILLDQSQSGVDMVSSVVERIRDAIGEQIELHGRFVRVTGSIGVAAHPDDGANADVLLANAEAAMYHAKQAGRNNIQFFKPEFNKASHNKLLLQEELRNALARSEFILHYQPQLDLRSGRIFAVEALIRWLHPISGLRPPAKFIPAAEESGLISAIGDWALREACRQNKAWQREGLPPIVMSVNVSARQFADEGLVEAVLRALRDSGLEARFLELELTESLIMQDVARAVATMNVLRDLGVQLSIDDFGTGYSSLAALKTFPVARLKIDKSFIDELAANESDRAVASAVISLGQKLNLRVIAEGVETAEQIAFLRQNDCDEIQGYCFSRPVPATDLGKLLQISAKSGEPSAALSVA